MKRFGKIALGTAAALCLSFVAGCSSSTPFMGNTREAVLEEGDVFAVISIMDYGDITVKLFPTVAPMAVTRFISLAENNYYDGRNIHRVVKDQLIQGGSLTGNGFDGDVLRQEYFDIETSDYMRHYYGALCMASNAKGNYCQFYIVNNNTKVNIDDIAGKVREDLNNTDISAAMLDSDKEYYSEYCKKLEDMPDEVKERYAQVGGIYDLDGTDTVFGQVVDGWDVLVALNQVETVAGNVSDDRDNIFSKPLDEIVIEKVEVIHITPVETVITTEEKTRVTRATPAENPGTASPDDIIINDGESSTTEEATTVESEAPEPVESDKADESGSETDESGPETDESSSEPDESGSETDESGSETDESGSETGENNSETEESSDQET